MIENLLETIKKETNTYKGYFCVVITPFVIIISLILELPSILKGLGFQSAKTFCDQKTLPMKSHMKNLGE